jgi:hypothetical protein
VQFEGNLKFWRNIPPVSSGSKKNTARQHQKLAETSNLTQKFFEYNNLTLAYMY